MKKQEFRYQHGKNYKCRPVLYESLVADKYLFDIDGTRLFAYDIDSFTIVKSIDVIDKDDQFCAKIRLISNKYIGVFGMYTFKIISIEKLEIIQTKQVPNLIQIVQAKNNYITILTSDDNGQCKLLYCFKINEEGKIEHSYMSVEVSLQEYQQVGQENLDIAIIESVFKQPRIYIFWKGTKHLIQVDPQKRLQQGCNKLRSINYIADINSHQYCEINGQKIVIWDKQTNKQVGTLTNTKQNFKKVIVKQGEVNQFYSISDEGVKKWKLKQNQKPTLFNQSKDYNIQNLYIDSLNRLIGINLEKRVVLIWNNQQQVVINNYHNEQIKKIIKFNQNQVCIFLQATNSKQQQGDYQVQKYHKMEIFDFEQGKQIRKKAVQKKEYKIDIDSAIADKQQNVYFILIQDLTKQVKKHIFRWSPFNQSKKQTKKRQIIDGHTYDQIRLYPFDRITTFKRSKNQQLYDLFGKATTAKSIVNVLDLNAKNIGNYDLPNEVVQIQLSSNNQLYALAKDSFTIYEINASSKNRLEKIHEIQTGFSFVCPFETYLFTKSQNSIKIYDKQFDLVLKEDEDEELDENKLLKISQTKFLLVNKNEISYWDLQKQQKKKLNLPGCDPNMIQLINSRFIILADKWIQCLDFQSLLK